MVVIVTGPAEADLETIADYIAAQNPFRALTFVRELREVVRILHGAQHYQRLLFREE